MAAEQTKIGLKHSLQAFADGNFTVNALSLFNALGYVTERQAQLRYKTKEEFAETFIPSDKTFDKAKARFTEWKYVDLLFQLSREEVLKQTSLFDTKKVDDTVIEAYLFFAIELSMEQYSRTELSLITREVNRLFPMPAMILFRHGNTLTLSVINRRLHKKDENKDVLEKVTLIKDISILSPHRAHIEILFDLSFDELKEKYKFTNFVELHRAWQKTLDTKELNDRFFKELSNWYFWATSKVSFPDDELKDKDIRNATGLIRLITRLIFVWFLKEKNLVPDDLFDEKTLKQLLKYTDKNKSTYYKAILQNLFFATLNTEMGKRKFRSAADKSQSGHYFIHNLFRYESQFTKPKETLEKYFAPVPFLNGGLFECLDKQVEVGGKLKPVRIDGFSDREDNILKVPDELFFSEKEKTIDLSKVYGTPKKSKEKVRGLIDILNSYKFTITENTPLEEEVALDPELLGRVFEDLLASYNPETQTTARKQTGSFYTPREIVNYMVDESLIAYLKQQFKNDPGEKLRDLLSYSENDNPFSITETEILIQAIDDIKILDPACGSGAFPMGILHKLVHVLHKLDPRNELWKQRQIKKASAIDDTASREAAIDTIEEAFENNELDYGRKLYLIENCIYGVDIQPIAVQIAKLRFFISLVVEQKTNPKRENLGVRPLPNLETKFVAANTLMELEKENANLFTNPEIEKKKEQLKKVRHDYFEARTPKRKENCRNRDKQLRDELAKLLIDNHDLQSATAKKIAAWNPYDQNSFATFFDKEWMFSIKEGFDIVIGNPPYGIPNKKQNKAESIIVTDDELEYYKSSDYYKPAVGGMLNIFRLFILRSIRLLKPGGIFSEIFPLAFTGDLSIKNLRKFILDNCQIQFIEAFPERDDPNKRVFEAVKMSVCILNLEFSKGNKPFYLRINDNRFINAHAEKNYLDTDLIKVLDSTNWTFPLTSKKETKLLSEIFQNSDRFSKIGKCNTGEIDMTFCKEAFSDNKNDAVLLKGAIIDRYLLRTKMSQGEIVFINEKKLSKIKTINSSIKESERIVLQGITGVNEVTRLKMMIVKNVYCANSLNYLTIFKDIEQKYLLAIFNSKLLNFVFSKFSTNSNVNGYEVDNLPIKIDNRFNGVLSKTANIVLTLKKSGIESSLFERLIDAMVYELYLPEAIQKGKCEILKYLENLPELKEGSDDETTKKNLKAIEKVYKELSDPQHPVSASMLKLLNVEEVNIIEGRK